MRYQVIAAAVAATLGASHPVFSQESSSGPLGPRPSDPPAALGYLQGKGVKLTFLGEDGGLRGYLGESPENKMQTFYVTPDGQNVVAGMMFRAGGTNVTGVQIGEMQARLDNEKAKLQTAKKELGADGAPLAPAIAPASPPSLPTADVSSKVLPPLPSQAPAPSKPDVNPGKLAPSSSPVTIGADKAPVPSVQPPSMQIVPTPSSVAGPARATPYRSELNKATFLADVDKVAWFPVGKPGTPVVYMIADPQCQFCHAAWQKLSPMVVAGKMMVDVILIDGLQGSGPLAISLLSRPDPAVDWFAGEGSADGVAIAPPPPPASPGTPAAKDQDKVKGWLAANGAFANSVHLKGTPLLAYVGKDGILYSAEGPRDLDSFLAAL